MAIEAGQKIYTVPVQGRPLTSDAAISSGMAFLVGELEKRDPRLLEPLASVTWPRDIVARTGGGFVDYTSNTFVDYATTGGGENGIIGGETNDIPLMQANISKDVYKVWDFGNILKVPFVDQQKLQNIGRSLNDILDRGIRLNYQKSNDNIVYVGVASAGVPGLINNPNVTTSTAAVAGASSPTGNTTSTKWVDKTPQQILNDVNNIINSTWANSEYDLSGMAQHILIPPSQFGYINGQPVTSAGTQSILNFLLENNIAASQGIDISIVPSRWCIGAGASSTDRMVGYVNSDDRVNFDQPVPLSRVMTSQSVEQLSYLTAYVAQIGQVKVLFNQCVEYVDGI